MKSKLLSLALSSLFLTTLILAQTEGSLDANAVGGMYSEKIHIIQTSKGLGVHSQQLPKSEEAKLNSDGKIDYVVPEKPKASQPIVETSPQETPSQEKTAQITETSEPEAIAISRSQARRQKTSRAPIHAQKREEAQYTQIENSNTPEPSKISTAFYAYANNPGAEVYAKSKWGLLIEFFTEKLSSLWSFLKDLVGIK